jgi:hypothetical protein
LTLSELDRTEAFNTSLAALAAAREAMAATRLGRDTLAEVEKTVRSGGRPAEGWTHGTCAAPDDDFVWDLQVREIPDAAGVVAGAEAGKLLGITLTVWRNGSARRYPMVTYVQAVESGSSQF